MDWFWWVGAAILLGVIELLSLDLVLIMFAGGALAAGAVSYFDGPLWLQIVVFGVVSIGLLGALRPWLLRHLRARTPLVETNTAAHVGRTAVVVDQVTGQGGRIKLEGEVWSARAEPATSTLPEGAKVEVLRIDGATAVVSATGQAV